jgi:hypothetical protein
VEYLTQKHFIVGASETDVTALLFMQWLEDNQISELKN